MSLVAKANLRYLKNLANMMGKKVYFVKKIQMGVSK